jgi:hypothetical protein
MPQPRQCHCAALIIWIIKAALKNGNKINSMILPNIILFWILNYISSTPALCHKAGIWQKNKKEQT